MLTSAVCKLDIPMPEKEKTAVRPSTKDSQSTGSQQQLPPVDPPSLTSFSQSVRVRITQLSCHTKSLKSIFSPLIGAEEVLS